MSREWTSGDRIRIDAPASEARRDRVEQRVFEQLSAIHAVERSAAYALPRRRSRLAIWFPAAACAAAIALAIIVLAGRDPAPSPSGAPDAPSLVETPVGGSSRFTVGEAVIQAGGDTSVGVRTSEAGVALVLGRGTIDCDVTPRPGRRPFRVIAGGVEVEVIGTRFAVTRIGDGARVDVTRGKVRVRTAAGERFLTAGQSWTPPSQVVPTAQAAQATQAAEAAPAAPASEPEDLDVIELPPESAANGGPNSGATSPSPSSQTPRDAFRAAQLLESTDPKRAARAYRTIANGKDAWAALALISLADLQRTGAPAQALRTLDELARRFPGSANAEDAAWLRVEALRRLNRDADARAAAQAYLRAFPHGTYAKSAAPIAEPR